MKHGEIVVERMSNMSLKERFRSWNPQPKGNSVKNGVRVGWTYHKYVIKGVWLIKILFVA